MIYISLLPDTCRAEFQAWPKRLLYNCIGLLSRLLRLNVPLPACHAGWKCYSDRFLNA